MIMACACEERLGVAEPFLILWRVFQEPAKYSAPKRSKTTDRGDKESDKEMYPVN